MSYYFVLIKMYNLNFLQRYNLHTIKYTFFKCTSHLFLVYWRLCTHHHYLILEHIHHLGETYTHSRSLPIFPSSPQTLTVTNLLAVPVDLPRLHIFYKWNPTVCGLLCLFHLLSIMFSGSIHVACVKTSFFMAQYSLVWIDYILLIHSSTDGHLGYFHLWAIVNLC